MLIVDNRLRLCERKFFLTQGFELINIPTNFNVYTEISSHVDIFVLKIYDKLICERSIFEYLSGRVKDNIICGSSTVFDNYPLDIAYNVCVLGDFAIHNFKYTDSITNRIIDNNSMTKININQGYSKCSIAVIDDNSCIVSDKSIYNALVANGIDVLYLDNSGFDIKLFDKDSNFSKMSGFIGGNIVRVRNFVVVFGDIMGYSEHDKIEKFVRRKKLQLIDFKGYELIDYGSVIEF